jgi:hypothetical protein
MHVHLVLGSTELSSLVGGDGRENFGVGGCEFGRGDGVDGKEEGKEEVEEALDL